MSILNLRYCSTLVLLVALLHGGQATSTSQPLQKDGVLVVNVFWGDMDNTPADDAYIEAYGFVAKDHVTKSFVLNMSREGVYKTSVPPGIYDVFISEGTSVPRCRRVLVRPGLETYWTVHLEVDDVYIDKAASRNNK